MAGCPRDTGELHQCHMDLGNRDCTADIAIVAVLRTFGGSPSGIADRGPHDELMEAVEWIRKNCCLWRFSDL